MDEPRFPSPDEARSREGVYRENTPAAAAPGVRPVVMRPEPPAEEPSSRDGRAHGSSKLTSEEIQALLAVEGASRPSPSKTLWRRGRIIIWPTGVLSAIAEVFFGDAAGWVVTGVALLAIAWMVKPLFKRDRWS